MYGENVSRTQLESLRSVITLMMMTVTEIVTAATAIVQGILIARCQHVSILAANTVAVQVRFA